MTKKCISSEMYLKNVSITYPVMEVKDCSDLTAAFRCGLGYDPLEDGSVRPPY